MSSNDPVLAGRTTTAEFTTFVIGAVPSEQNVDFDGDFIFVVAPQDGDLAPLGALNAIIGIGSNSITTTPATTTGGTGVMGRGGPNRGTGIQGDGGNGGSGVIANGGNGSRAVFHPLHPAGIGLLARGGRLLDNSEGAATTNRAPNGPGVIGCAGGAPLPDIGVGNAAGSTAVASNVGVFGQGGDAVAEVNAGTPNFVLGALTAGAGVVGRGGVSKSNGTTPTHPPTDVSVIPGGEGAGVIGLGGSVVTPTLAGAVNAGVFGELTSGSGVSGLSTDGIGVTGVSTTSPGVSGVNLSSDPAASAPGVTGFAAANCGGVFSSSSLAQLSLTPIAISGTPTIEGLPGDLLATIDRANVAHLWFCKVAGTTSWVQLA